MSKAYILKRNTEVFTLSDWVDIHKVATNDDYKAFCLVYLASFGDTIFRRLFLKFNRQEIFDTGYVWLYEGRGAGIYSLKDEAIFRDDCVSKILYNFTLVDVVRSNGYSKALLASALGDAYKLGFSELFLKVDSDNVKALNLYKTFGFKKAQD